MKNSLFAATGSSDQMFIVVMLVGFVIVAAIVGLGVFAYKRMRKNISKEIATK